jgi:hypothetical protein
MSDAAGWRWWLPRVFLVFIVARLILVGCAAAAEAVAAPSPDGPSGSVVRADNRPVLGSFTTWDAVYYLGIARDGYHAGATNGPYPETVFFPLYPALVAAVAPLVGGDLALAAVLVANVASLVGLCGMYLLARRSLGPNAALLAVMLVALQPGAVAFSMAYSDGLFLALVVGTFLFAGPGSGSGSSSGSRPTWARLGAGLLGLLCGLTRLQGALLVLPLLILFYRADGNRFRVSWLAALGPLVGLALACGYIGTITGDPLAPLLQQAAWDFGAVAGAVAEPWVLVLAAAVYLGTAAVFLRLLIDRWRWREDPAGVTWAVLNAGALVVARRVQSLPRYLAPVVQLAEEFASGRRSQRFVRLVLTGSVAGYAVLALLHFSLKLAP